jgi:3'-phosphoadenosine 5'-phosphosulfate sulfotransferase (PAPS reductase)/FAD synthetase
MISAPTRPITLFDRLVHQGHLLPVHEYDGIICSVSGGKDSLALTLQMLEWAVEEQDYPKDRIELWHQDIDGGIPFMDWPCTRNYCIAVAKALDLSLRFQWKHEGFHGELFRENAGTKGVFFEDEEFELVKLDPSSRAKPATRRKFPAKTADLRTRWCSPYLKIDVARRAFNNDPRFRQGNYLFLTGERRQESAARSKYDEVAVYSHTRKRRADQWRSVIDWDERFVWEIMERWGIIPHPAYRLGWGRVSCMACIFGDKDQWATIRRIAPDTFERIRQYEVDFDHTIDNRLSVVELADKGSPFDNADPALVELAMSHDYPEDLVLTDQWELPAGAYKSCGGPT